jgi:hypothetical protein
MPLIKIVSGGQTGVDQAALDAAIHCSIPHGGWCPKGRINEYGRIHGKYDLKETSTSDYLARTEANVVDSDATLIITPKRLNGGSLRTLEFCMKHRKPWHHVSFETTPQKKAVEEIMLWLNGDPEQNDYEDYEACPPKQCVLNVAGTRGSKLPVHENVIVNLLLDVIWKANGKMFYPLDVPKPDCVD